MDWIQFVATPLWPSVGVKPNTPKVGDLESSGTSECLEFDSKAQNYSHWGVLGVIGKVLKLRYRKWPCIGHLDICSPSYGQKKEIDLFPTSDLECNKSLERSRRGLQLWFKPHRDPTLQSGVMSSQSPGRKSHLDVASVESCRKYYKGEGGGFPRVRAVVSQVSPNARGLSQHLRVFPNAN